jgi:hypothetical protein
MGAGMTQQSSSDQILARLRVRGVEFKAFGDSIRFRPKSALSSDEVRALERNKGSVLSALYREQALENIQPTQPELLEIEQRVKTEGYLLLWSSLFNDLIAFCDSPSDAERVPRGIVAYTADELLILFGDPNSGPSEGALQLIHQAKQFGGGILSDSTDGYIGDTNRLDGGKTE